MKYLFIIITLSFALYSCSTDDYLIDGGKANPQLGMSTSAFLKSHNQLDTLAILIDRAQFTSIVDGDVTLFAPNNLSIQTYVNRKLTDLRKSNPQAKFSIDDIPKDTLVKYLGAYIFQGKIKRENLRKEGDLFTALNGEQKRLSLEPVAQYTGQLDSYPEYVYYSTKQGASWDPWDKNDDDFKVVIRTSNLESTNGIIHVLQGSHSLFNYETKN